MKISRWQRIKWAVPLVLYLTTIIDSALPSIFPTQFLGHSQTIISHLTLFYIINFAFYFRDSNILLYSFLFGLFYDSYNTTILGLYAILYWMIAYFILKIKRYFPKRPIILALLFLLIISALDFCVFVFYREINFTSITLTNFLADRLTPTLIFNIVFMILLYIPNKHLLRWLGYEDYIIF